MRSRSKQVIVRLNDREHAHLQKQLALTGLSCAAFIRALIMGTSISPRPPDEYAALLRELSAIGRNINQVAKIANANGAVNEQVVAQLAKTQMVIWKKVKDMR